MVLARWNVGDELTSQLEGITGMFHRFLRGLGKRRHDELEPHVSEFLAVQEEGPIRGKTGSTSDQDELVASAFFLVLSLSLSLCAACHGVVTSDLGARVTHVRAGARHCRAGPWTAFGDTAAECPTRLGVYRTISTAATRVIEVAGG
ncbi:MAG: hypothetical protein M1815_005725 [Lichina confinis]|nr:MAG: hypothetical protein M1815_005725 [Lichina confinis]